MPKNSWKTTPPPKRRRKKPVRLRYRNSSWNTKPQQGDFFWSDQEKAWIECVEGPDGIGLYADDGWEVLGWR